MLSTTLPPRPSPARTHARTHAASRQPPRRRRGRMRDSPALSGLAAGPVLGAASLLADGFSSSVEERGKVGQPPAEFLSFPPFVRTGLCQPAAEALKVSHIPEIPPTQTPGEPPARFRQAKRRLFVYLFCSSPSGWSSPPCTLCSRAGRTRNGRSSRRGGGTPCCTWSRSSARHSAP